MLREDVEELLEASELLEKILSTAAQRRLLFLTPEVLTGASINDITSITAMRVSFSYLPHLTTAIQFYGIEGESHGEPCLETQRTHEQTSIELAVGIQPAIFTRQVHSYLKTLVGQANEVPSYTFFDIPLKNFKGITDSSPSLWPENSVLLSATLIAQLPAKLVSLILLLLPEHEGLWVARRAKLWSREPDEALLTMSQVTGSNANEPATASAILFTDCIKELVLTDLLLSFFYKSKSAWFHREWILKHMLQRQPLRYKGNVFSCYLHNVWHSLALPNNTSSRGGCKAEKKRSKGNVALELLSFIMIDNETLNFACDKHLMNYNAWQYRRVRLSFFRNCNYPGECTAAMSLFYHELIQRECEAVMSYLDTHNADSSACSFLLFLLYQCTPTEDRHLQGRSSMTFRLTREQRVSLAQYAPYTSTVLPTSYAAEVFPARAPLSVILWRRLMYFTQRELRRHADRGHEAMWHLRFGLIHYALTINSKSSLLRHHLLSSWTMKDELEWISTYVESFTDTFSPRMASSYHDEVLLSPCGVLMDSWVESSGSASWTSYLATRYGLLLLAQCSQSNLT